MRYFKPNRHDHLVFVCLAKSDIDYVGIPDTISLIDNDEDAYRLAIPVQWNDIPSPSYQNSFCQYGAIGLLHKPPIHDNPGARGRDSFHTWMDES